jgi:hypothetical protein
MQLELEEAARSLVAAPVVPPAPLAAIESRARALRTRARQRWIAGTVVASLIVTAFVVVIARSDSSSSRSVVVGGAGPANVVTTTNLALDRVVESLRSKCGGRSPDVSLVLTESRLRFNFSCSDVLHNPRRVENQALAKVAARRNAAVRAAAVVAYEKQLGVYGDLVKGRREYPDDERDTTFSLGTATGTDYLCEKSADLKFRANEIRYAAQGGESAVHWLKIEAARIAGRCPEKLDTLYDTVQRAGQSNAVATVKPLLIDAMSRVSVVAGKGGATSTVACPSRVGFQPLPSQPNAPTSTLVWEQPLGGLLCRYYPIGGVVGPSVPHGTLYGASRLDARLARQAATILNDQQQPQVGITHCPADFVAWDLVIFQYADRGPLTVAAKASGCPSFRNGRFATGSFSSANGDWVAFRDALVPTRQQSK